MSYALFTYIALGLLAVTMCLAMLAITKIPTFVMLGSSFATASLYLFYARLVDGYWDKFAGIAFIVCVAYALAISTVVLAIGRYQKRPFFLGNKETKDVQH